MTDEKTREPQERGRERRDVDKKRSATPRGRRQGGHVRFVYPDAPGFGAGRFRAEDQHKQ
jgi:hypothetical protein